MVNNIAVFGASGALGYSFTKRFAKVYPEATIHAIARNPSSFSNKNIIKHKIDYTQEPSIESVVTTMTNEQPLDIVLVVNGILHDGDIMPEKSLRELSAEKLQHIFSVNTIVPTLIAKYTLPQLNNKDRAVFAAMSARVGSISDNLLGGWYAYRVSKAGLNMVIKNAAIEVARRNKEAIIVGLHPGTVESRLSEPFRSNVPKEKLFTPDFAAQKLSEVLQNLTPQSSGKCFAWDGEEITP